jgi:nucleotide-binding universal stress UspA family protein
MRGRVRERYRQVKGLYLALRARIRRVERREIREFRGWLENTRNLLHLSVLVFLPLLLGLVTIISSAVEQLAFLLFPPLASGTYTLFAQPESKYASPRRFVGGLTLGALCGWGALETTARYWYQVDPAALGVHPGAVAFGIFLTGAATWALDLEEASAFSAALLVHVTGTSQFAYVVSVFVSSSLIAIVFTVWRETFYEQRAKYLYESTKGDDHVLVPMRTESADATAMLAGRLAAAHDAGKVVLLDLVDDEATADAERALIDRDATEYSPQASTDGGRSPTDDNPSEPDSERDEKALGAETIGEMEASRVAATAATELEEQAGRIETQIGVPCEVVIAVDGGSPAATVLQTAHRVNCDLIAAPYEERHGSLSPYLRTLFRGDLDILVHRSRGGRTRWRRVMVPVRRASDLAHAMIDFGLRLTGDTGHVSICNCVDSGNRRRSEEMLSDLAEPFSGPLETRVSRAEIEDFLDDNANQYDMVFMGASMDRSAASRFISPPTFERIRDLDCDVAIVDRNHYH